MVKFYYMDAIEQWQKASQKRAINIRVTVNVYIDDFIITFRGDRPNAMAHTVISAVWDLEVMVQQQIRASLVAKKTRVTSNDHETAQKMRRQQECKSKRSHR